MGGERKMWKKLIENTEQLVNEFEEWKKLIENTEQLVNEFEELKRKFFLLLDEYNSKFRIIDLTEPKDEIAKWRKEVMKLKSERELGGASEGVDGQINDLNKKILNLQNEVQKQKDKVINTNFPKKIITSAKSDIIKAREIIKQSKSINPQMLKNEQHEFLKIYKPLTKLEKHFTRINRFIREYVKILSDFLNKKIEFEYVKESLEKLEQREMVASLKKCKETYSILSDTINPEYRKELLKLFDKRKTKITKLTTASDSFPVGEYILKTPFGEVRVKSKPQRELMIYPEKSNFATSYDSIVYNLDQLFEKEELTEDRIKLILLQVINPILTYLKQKIEIQDIRRNFTDEKGNLNLKLSVQKCQELLNKIDGCRTDASVLNDNQKTCAAVLCGILMLSESHDIRNPTFGKLERNAIKNVKYLANLAKKGCVNPFEKTFSNKAGRYVPAHDTISDANLIDLKPVPGGKKQTQLVLGCIVDDEQNIHIPKASLPDNFTKYTAKIIEDISRKNVFSASFVLKEDICKIWECTDENSFKKKFNSLNPKDKTRKCEETITILNKNGSVGQGKNIKDLFLLLKFQTQINFASDKNKFNGKPKKEYLKVLDLPGDEKFDKFNFGGVIKTPKKFFSDQIMKNMKKLYKIQNRTLTTKMLEQLK